MKPLLVVLTICCVSTLVFGQDGAMIKSVGNTAKEKLNAQDFNTTRNNKERGNLINTKKSNEAAPAPANTPEERIEPIEPVPSGEYQSAYTFTSSVTYDITSAQKGTGSQTMSYSFGDQVIQMEMPGQDMTSIVDSKNGVMIMLNHKAKTAMVMSTKAMEIAMKQQMSKDEPEATITKTGRTKTILGYTCEEMLIESDRKTAVWITRESGIDVGSSLVNLNKTSPSQIPKEAFAEGGMLMEMTSYDAAGKTEMHLLVKSLSKESKTVNIGAYKITKL